MRIYSFRLNGSTLLTTFYIDIQNDIYSWSEMGSIMMILQGKRMKFIRIDAIIPLDLIQ
jgi:hypothetical protein